MDKATRWLFIMLIAALLSFAVIAAVKADDGEDDYNYAQYSGQHHQYNHYQNNAQQGDAQLSQHYSGSGNEREGDNNYDFSDDFNGNRSSASVGEGHSTGSAASGSNSTGSSSNSGGNNDGGSTGNHNNNQTSSAGNTGNGNNGGDGGNSGNNTGSNNTGNNNSGGSRGNSRNSGGITSAQVATHNIFTDCWVIVFGNVYNITSLLTTHTGGNVFTCGSNETTLYLGQHGTNTARLNPYYLGPLASLSSRTAAISFGAPQNANSNAVTGGDARNAAAESSPDVRVTVSDFQPTPKTFWEMLLEWLGLMK